MYVQGYPYQSPPVATVGMKSAPDTRHVPLAAPTFLRPPPQLNPTVEHGYPTISGIRQIQKGSEPFKVFLHFWITGCVPSAGNTTWWHCTFTDMHRQGGRGVRFWLHASEGHGDLAKLHSNTKTYVDIICSSSRVSASITADSIFKHLFSGNTTGLITETEYSALYDAADDLDVQFVKDDRHWESFVQTQRDNVLHRSKRTKRA
jgi:hypothetical protein